MRTRFHLLSICLILTLSGVAVAQRGPQPESITGKVKEVKKKGRLKVLVVTTDDGTEMEFPVTPKVQFEVTAKGDAGFVRPGVFLTAKATLTANQLFVRNVRVLLIDKGQRTPTGKITKAQPKPGASVNSFDVSGELLARQMSPDYPDYEVLALKIPGRVPPVMLEKNFSVTVVSQNPESATPDSPVELQVTKLRGDRLNLVSATVTLAEPMKASEVFGDSDEQ